jgi:hypothetical protein
LAISSFQSLLICGVGVGVSPKSELDPLGLKLFCPFLSSRRDFAALFPSALKLLTLVVGESSGVFDAELALLLEFLLPSDGDDLTLSMVGLLLLLLLLLTVLLLFALVPFVTVYLTVE